MTEVEENEISARIHYNAEHATNRGAKTTRAKELAKYSTMSVQPMLSHAKDFD